MKNGRRGLRYRHHLGNRSKGGSQSSDRFMTCADREELVHFIFNVGRGQRCRHHLVNRSKGGSNQLSNRALLKVEREQKLHLLFGNKNQYQILRELRHINKCGSGILDGYIRVFQRFIRAKENQSRGESGRWCTRKVG